MSAGIDVHKKMLAVVVSDVEVQDEYRFERRLGRTVTRRKYRLTRDHVRLQNQLESLLEAAPIKLSILVSPRKPQALSPLADGNPCFQRLSL
jgi:hypothetical protein